MSKLFISTFMLFTAFLAIGCKSKQDDWNLVISAPQDYLAYNAAFLDDQVGFSGGHLAVIEKYQGENQDWSEVFPPNQQGVRFALDVVNSEVVFASTTDGLDRSLDGGSTWERISEGLFYLISFSNESSGWAWDDSQCWRTQNGGDTWETLTPPLGVSGLYGLSSLSYDQGFLLGKDGILYYSSNGGEDWKSIAVLDELQDQDFIPNKTILFLRFIDENQGTLLIMDRKVPFRWLVCETIDQGENWDVQILQREMMGKPYISRDLNTITLVEKDDVYASVYVFQREKSEE